MRSLGALLLLMLVGQAPPSFAFDPIENIDKAEELINTGEYSLARSYLAPAIVSPYISSGLRAQTYFMRGYSYAMQEMYVSAIRDYNRALEFAPEYGAVLTEIGAAYQYGRGVDKDLTQAYYFFSQAADLDNAQGMFKQGYALLNGLGVEKNIPHARLVLAKAAAREHGFAHVEFGGQLSQNPCSFSAT